MILTVPSFARKLQKQFFSIKMCVGEGGGKLSDVSLFRYSIDDLSGACVSMTVNQIEVIMPMPACEALQPERTVTTFKNSSQELWL